jgi:hypothetical protein
VQQHGDVVEVGVASSVASGIVFALVATDDQNVESAIERTDARRRTLGLSDEGDGGDGVFDLGEDQSADGCTADENHDEGGAQELEYGRPRARLLEAAVPGDPGGGSRSVRSRTKVTHLRSLR